MPGLMRLSKVGLVRAADVSEQVAEQYGELLDHSADLLEEIVDRTEKTIREIDASQEFTPKGKATAIAKARAKAAESIREELETRRRKLDQEHQKAKQALPTELHLPTGPDRDYELQQLIELRSWLRDMQPAERVAALQQAASDGDGQLVLAVATAPKALRLLPSTETSKAVEQILRREHPAEFAAVDRAEGALRLLESNTRRAAEAAASSKMLEPDVTASVAAGGEQADAA